MTIWLMQGQAWFSAREKREQYLLSVVAIGLVAWLGYLLLLEPSALKRTQIERQIGQNSDANSQYSTTSNRVASAARKQSE